MFRRRDDKLQERCYRSVYSWPQELWFDLHQEFEDFLIASHESAEIVLPVRLLKYGSWEGMTRYCPHQAPASFDEPVRMVRFLDDIHCCLE